MKELKPRLIITSPGRKRRGFGTFMMVLVIFAIGFYTGSKYGDYLFGTESPEVSARIQGPGSASEEQVVSGERDVPGRGNTDIIYSDDKQSTGDQKSLIEGGFIGAEMLEGTGSYPNAYPDGADQKSFMGNEDIARGEGLTSGFDNNTTAESDNDADTAVEDAGMSGSSYTLQLGAFSTPEEARAVADGYKNKGYDAYIVPIENSRGEKWNLVKIGKFNTIDQAWSYSAYFKNREGLDVYVELVEQGTVFNESWSQQEVSGQQ